MKLTFYKYQGTGNDFILVDDRKNRFPETNQSLVAAWCDRKFGIGADGLILLRNSQVADFNMVYFNADGRESSLCGNGSRCLVAFAQHLDLISERTVFEASDGLHEAHIHSGKVSLKMNTVTAIQEVSGDWVLDTGSPHYVSFDHEVSSDTFVSEARTIRNSDRFKETGINVNFVEEQEPGQLRMRTYERGVEDETLSCGTGVTAAALAAAQRSRIQGELHYVISTEGGKLEVTFEQREGTSDNIWLIGPATFVFKGEMAL